VTARPSRRAFLKQAGLAAALAASGAARAQEGKPKPPNIVLIIADDLGYGEVSCYPSLKPVKTPNIDRIARDGVLLTQGYAEPMCLPTRAALLTGRYWQGLANPRNIPTDVPMIPQFLKPAGYRAACIGKWHNTGSVGEWDGKRANTPLGRGFDEFFGFLGGMHDHFQADRGYQTGRGWISMPVYDGTTPVPKTKYFTHEFTDRAVAFIERNQERPFFLYLSYNAVHTPVQAPEDLVKKHGGDAHRAMIDALDQGVGSVLDALERHGLAESSLVVFIGDNGGYRKDANWKLRGRKGCTFEGGIRVPYLLRWPKGLPRGKTYDGLATQRDLLPTFVAAAGLELPADAELDGVSLLPYLRGEKEGSPHDVLFWGARNGSRFAVRRGDWKLVRDSESRKAEPTLCLHNLAEDIGERRSLLATEKAVADELRKLYDQWSKKIAARRKR